MDVAEKKVTTGESAREARRRKILDRGSDRIAFITGQIRSIPPPENPLPPPPPPPPPEPSSQQVPVDSGANFNVSRKAESDSYMKFDTFSGTSSVTPEVVIGSGLIPKYEIGNEYSLSSKTEKDSAQLSPDVNVDAAVSYVKWSPREISSCITSSENIRLLCAIAIAILVIISYRGYGLGIQVAMNLVAFRPLFLVLLTDITIGIGMLLGNKVNVVNGQREQAIGIAFELGKLLEVGLMLQKVIRAAILDCSVCALIMMVGIPFGAKGVA